MDAGTSGSAFSLIYSGMDSTYNVTVSDGLVSGKEYTFYTIAYNNIGSSD